MFNVGHTGIVDDRIYDDGILNNSYDFSAYFDPNVSAILMKHCQKYIEFFQTTVYFVTLNRKVPPEISHLHTTEWC